MTSLRSRLRTAKLALYCLWLACILALTLGALPYVPADGFVIPLEPFQSFNKAFFYRDYAY
ncbi:MAG: hypothetical protein AAFY72_15545 [Cyanobacteria bacterium J06649_4]